MVCSNIDLPITLNYIGDSAFEENILTSFLLPGKINHYTKDAWKDNEGNLYNANYTTYKLEQGYTYIAKGFSFRVILDNNDIVENHFIYSVFGENMPYIAAPHKTGYVFHGYYTEQNGVGTQYYDEEMNSKIPWDIASDTILFAYWTETESDSQSESTKASSSEAFSAKSQDQTPEPEVREVTFIDFDTNMVPDDTKYILLPCGETIELSTENPMRIKVPYDDLDAGMIEFMALNAEQVPIGSVDINANQTHEDKDLSTLVILLFSIATLFIGAGGALIIMKNKNDPKITPLTFGIRTLLNKAKKALSIY